MFTDRAEAGRQLAEALTPLLHPPAGVPEGPPAIVLALPRGGVPVAAEVAARHHLPLDLLLVRKVGLPSQPELAVAAIAGPAGEHLVINRDVARMAGLDEDEIAALAEPERAELQRRRRLYLGDRPAPELRERSAIIVDDGIATGATMRAAVRAARAAGATRIVLAVPVAARDSLEVLKAMVDDVVALDLPGYFGAVGAHYRSFPQVSDDEVARLLKAASGDGETAP
ncbi:phosphoribosyltransferase [Acidimangrovimonas pyrenivorans]|uniref:Phosphoribosyltransferase n=1 Tax=Acidimangrovimonas pyrenivorans TaxID=2030798 RepID=A0ABV7AJZ9_9RHOB